MKPKIKSVSKQAEFNAKFAEAIGYDQGFKKAKLKALSLFNELIRKYDSNWFYIECKTKYGNDVIELLDEITEDINKQKAKMRLNSDKNENSK